MQRHYQFACSDPLDLTWLAIHGHDAILLAIGPNQAELLVGRFCDKFEWLTVGDPRLDAGERKRIGTWYSVGICMEDGIEDLAQLVGRLFGEHAGESGDAVTSAKLVTALTVLPSPPAATATRKS
jgi:hypothetical protein